MTHRTLVRLVIAAVIMVILGAGYVVVRNGASTASTDVPSGFFH